MTDGEKAMAKYAIGVLHAALARMAENHPRSLILQGCVMALEWFVNNPHFRDYFNLLLKELSGELGALNKLPGGKAWTPKDANGDPLRN